MYRRKDDKRPDDEKLDRDGYTHAFKRVRERIVDLLDDPELAEVSVRVVAPALLHVAIDSFVVVSDDGGVPDPQVRRVVIDVMEHALSQTQKRREQSDES